MIQAQDGGFYLMVVGDDHDFAFHDGGKSVPVLGLKSPEIPAPNKGAIMVQTKKVVRFLGSPGYEDEIGVDTEWRMQNC